MNARKKYLLISASASLLLLLVAGAAMGSHLEPKGATPFRASLVPASKPCAAPNRLHAPGIPACNPPANTSTYLQVGTPLVNGAPRGLIGYLLLQTINAGTSTEDGKVTLVIPDVRCKPAAPPSTCTSANVGGTPPDYGNMGEVLVKYTVRITGHSMGTTSSGGTDPGTTADFPFSFSVSCTNTISTTIGGNCNVITTYDTILPGIVPNGSAPNCATIPGPAPRCRDVWEYGQVQVYDGGADAVGSTEGDNTLFLVQGQYFP